MHTTHSSTNRGEISNVDMTTNHTDLLQQVLDSRVANRAMPFFVSTAGQGRGSLTATAAWGPTHPSAHLQTS